jgi:putative lipoic acid-binding regulatory protein
MDKPKIDYPCSWVFKIIGEDSDSINIAVKEVIGDKEHKLEDSKKSSKGKYISKTLECNVSSEDERHNIFRMLKASEFIKVVL